MINRMMFAALVATLGIGSAIAQPTASEPPKCEPFPPDPPQQIACLRQTVDSLKTVIGTLQTELESLQQQITIELGTAVKKGQPVNLVHRQSNINIDECLTGGGSGPLRTCAPPIGDQNQTFTIRDSAFK